ncbi:polysaccharide biosynthesis C-terminal domain-containing protein [Nocardioides sp. J54]|uniref:polysaccharide biosynthesis C-terminal domain-containing protein n=1 Tax=Nocardioides sp. J54 TaxID=935866 RepID=UPI0004B1D513|nr:lipopolysaccharide biosynthesis protein [Nocardioides sp. J54]
MTRSDAADRAGGHLRAVARGSAGTLLGAVVSTVAGFGLVLLVTHTVPADTAGRFFAASAVFLLALATAGLGTDTGLARFVLRAGDPAAVAPLVRTAAVPVLVAATVLALVLAAVWSDTRALVWALPLAAASDLALAAIRAHALFRATVLIDRLVRPGVQLVLVALVVATEPSGAGIAAAWAAAYVVSALLSLRALRVVLRRPGSTGHGGPAGPGETVSAGDFWRFTWLRGVARVAQMAIQKVDVVVVAWLLSPAEAALYAVATRFVVFGQLANQAVSTVVQPRFTMILAEGDGPEHRALVGRVFAVTTGWSILSAWPVYLCVVAAPAAYLGWFGEGYVTGDAVAVAVVMCCGMLVAVASGPVDTLLLMIGRSGRSLANTLVALAVDVGLCLLLVPRMGIAGAAVAWVVAVVVRCLLAVVQLRSDIELQVPVRALLRAASLPVGCLLVPLGAAHVLLGLTPLTWVLACLLAGAAYVAAVWRLREPLAVDHFVAGLRSGRQREAVAA